MSTTKKAKTKASKTEIKASQSKRDDLYAAGSSPEHEEQSATFPYESEIEDPDPSFREYDIVLNWKVEIVAGEDNELVKFIGSSTMNRLLAPENIAHSPEQVRAELEAKVARVAAGMLQHEANRLALNNEHSQ